MIEITTAAAATHLMSVARNIIVNPFLSTHSPLLFFNSSKNMKMKLLSRHTSEINSSCIRNDEELTMKRFTMRRNPIVSTCCFLGGVAAELLNTRPSNAADAKAVAVAEADVAMSFIRNIKLEVRFVLADLELHPDTAKLAIGLIGPFLSAFSFLFILRIVMSWYPKIPLEKFPYVVAYAPTEPFLVQTRKLIPPLAGVDITPVVWVGLLNFLNEILVGPQGLLVLLSQQLTTK